MVYIAGADYVLAVGGKQSRVFAGSSLCAPAQFPVHVPEREYNVRTFGVGFEPASRTNSLRS